MKSIKIVAVVGLLAGMMASAYAQSIMGNLVGSYGTGTNLGLGTDAADRTKAIGLTIGAGLPFLFQDMQAIISNPDGLERLLTGGIFADSAGSPGMLLAAFNPVAVAPGTNMANISITTTTPFTLQPGITYWFVLDGPAVANGLMWNSTVPNTSPTGSSGVTFAGYRFSSNGGGTWTSSSIFNGMQINAAPIPEPSTWAMVGVGGTLLLGAMRFRRRS